LVGIDIREAKRDQIVFNCHAFRNLASITLQVRSSIISQLNECNLPSKDSMLNKHVAVIYSLARVQFSLLGVADHTCRDGGPSIVIKLLNCVLIVGNLDLDIIYSDTCWVVYSDNHVIVCGGIRICCDGTVEVSAILALAPGPARL